jgi:hypothetical protein
MTTPLNSVKGRFMGRYGSRDTVLKAIANDEMSHYDMGHVVKNPYLTHADLHGWANDDKCWFRQHAHNEYFNRYGVMPTKV